MKITSETFLVNSSKKSDMEYKVKLKNHKGWTNITADSPGDAVQEFHLNHCSFEGYNYHSKKGPTGESVDVTFVWIEVDGHGEYLSRIWHSGIRRKGGFSRFNSDKEKLEWVAKQLGWKDVPEKLLEPGWENEEEDWK